MKNLIVIPAYNEQEALPKTLAELEELPTDFEVLVVNDGSIDKTSQVVTEFARSSHLKVHLINLSMNCGIGGAVQTGYLFAARMGIYTYVMQFDSDGQHDGAFIEPMVQKCREENLDLCVGSRFLEKQQNAFRSTFFRRLGIRFFAGLIKILSGTKTTDPTSGFRCAGPRAWKHFAEQYPDDYPEPETLFWCARNKLRIGEIAVRMRQRRGGISSIRHFQPFYYMVKVTMSILFDLIRSKERSN